MFCSCQTYPVCRWACVHLFQPARTYAPLRVQHACKFPTQMVWDIVVRTKHRASHTARTGVSRLLKVTGLNDRKRSALKFNHVVQRRRQRTQKCSTPAKTPSGLSPSLHHQRRRGRCCGEACACVCLCACGSEQVKSCVQLFDGHAAALRLLRCVRICALRGALWLTARLGEQDRFSQRQGGCLVSFPLPTLIVIRLNSHHFFSFHGNVLVYIWNKNSIFFGLFLGSQHI